MKNFEIYDTFPDLKEKVVRLVDQGFVIRELAEELNLTHETINKWKNKAMKMKYLQEKDASRMERERILFIMKEISERGPENRKRGARGYPKKIVNLVIDLIKQGYTVREIAEKTKVSYGTIDGWKRKAIKNGELGANGYHPQPHHKKEEKQNKEILETLKELSSKSPEPPPKRGRPPKSKETKDEELEKLKQEDELDVPDNYISDKNRIKMVMTESIAPLSRYKK